MYKENFIEKESVLKFEALDRLFKENFNPEKTIELKDDLDEHNQPRQLGDYQAFWTEFRNPDTDEVVEGKVYIPKEIEDCSEVLIISPGYRGDFVLQEADYADDFVKERCALIVLRHNGLKITGDKVQNYIHCPDKVKVAKEKNQEYLGKEEPLDFKKAGREVLTVLKSFSQRIDKIDKIHILGHSWGGRIALDSLLQLTRESDEIVEKIKNKIKNLILLGAWLETREDKIKNFQEFFEDEAKENYFKDMDTKKVIDDLVDFGNQLKELNSNDLPKNMQVVGIESVEDETIDDLQGEIFPFFTRIKQRQDKGNIVLKDLKKLLYPKQIGGRESEVHDYAIEEVRKWIKKIILTSK